MNIWKDFHPSAETINTWYAQTIIGTLAMAFVFFPVPLENKELVTFALGAIAGALTMGNRRTDRVPPAGEVQPVVVVNSPETPAQVEDTHGPEGAVRRDP